MATQTTVSLGQQFEVSGVYISINFDTRINVKKRKEKLVCRTLSNQDNINLAYLMSSDTTPQDNLYIADRSTSLNQNRIPSSFEYVSFTGSKFYINTDKFLVTDIFTTETATQPAKPLFYYHKLKYFNSGLTDFADRDLLAYEFVDSSLTTKKVTEYSFDSATGKLYNNILNSYDVDTGHDVTFIKYTVRTTVGSVATITVHHELVNNETVFVAATFDDIDEWGNLEVTADAYLVTQLPGSTQFEVTLPVPNDYAYQEIYNSRIKLKWPSAIDIDSPWYVKAINGKFLASIPNSLISSVLYKYYLPEFDSQVFFPYPPYKIHNGEEAVWLSSSLVKTASNIVNSSGFFVKVIIEDSDENVLYAYSNNPTEIGTAYNVSVNYTDGILSIDSLGGFLELKDEISDEYKVVVSYTSEEEDYEFVDVNFNPVSNMEIIDKRVVLYIVPESPTTGELDKSLYYLWVDPAGKIEYCSQAEEGSTTLASTQRLQSEDFFTDGSPRHVIYYDKDSTASGLRATVSGYFSSFMDDFSFKDKYTTESTITPQNYTTASGLLGGITGAGELLKNLADNPQFLLLGDVFVGERANAENANLIDIRTDGGGIKTEYEDAALLEEPEVSWYSDLTSRKPYPGAMSFLVEIPKTVLTEYGGDYTYEQLRPIVEKHTAFGTYAAIRTYGIDPVLTSGTGYSGYLSIGWPSYGSSVSYNVYYSKNQTEDFILSNTSNIADVSSGNTYSVTGLTTPTDYYVYVGAIDSNGYEYAGPVYHIATEPI